MRGIIVVLVFEGYFVEGGLDVFFNFRGKELGIRGSYKYVGKDF